MDEDFFGGIGGRMSGDPMTDFGQVSSVFDSGADAYRFTGRYGTLTESTRQRARQQETFALKQHMLQIEAQRLIESTIGLANSGKGKLSPEQIQALQAFPSSAGAQASIAAMTMLGVSTPFDSVQAAVGLESALRYSGDPMTGMPGMGASTRAQIAAHVATQLYQPGQGRSMAGGLSGEDIGRLAESMAASGALGGSAAITYELESFQRNFASVPGGALGRPVVKGSEEAARLEELDVIAGLKAAANDPNASPEETKKAMEEYEIAVKKATGNRIAKELRARAQTVTAIQSHYEAAYGQTLDSAQASAVVDELFGGEIVSDPTQRGLYTQQLMNVARSRNLSHEQMTGMMARGRQFLDAAGMQGTGLGASVALTGGYMMGAMEDAGYFTDTNRLFGVGSREQELMKASMMEAQFLGSGVNQAKMTLMRAASSMESMGGELTGRAGELARKLRNGESISDADYEFLSRPDLVIQGISDGSGGSISTGQASEMLGDERAMREQAFNDPTAATAGNAEIKQKDRLKQFKDSMAGALADTDVNNPLAAGDQRAALEATLAELQNLTPEQMKAVQGGNLTGGVGMQDAVRNALVKMRDAGQIDFKDEELDDLITGVSRQATDALNAATDASGEESVASYLLSINNDTLKTAAKQQKVDKMAAQMELELKNYSGEGPLTGLLAMLEAAGADGAGTDVPEIVKALASGAADEKQAEIVTRYKDVAGQRVTELEKDMEAAKAAGNADEVDRLDIEIGATKAFMERLDKTLKMDEKPEAGGTEGAPAGGGDIGPGGAGGNISLSGVTISINGKPILEGVAATGTYGGRNAVPMGQVS